MNRRAAETLSAQRRGERQPARSRHAFGDRLRRFYQFWCIKPADVFGWG